MEAGDKGSAHAIHEGALIHVTDERIQMAGAWLDDVFDLVPGMGRGYVDEIIAIFLFYREIADAANQQSSLRASTYHCKDEHTRSPTDEIA